MELWSNIFLEEADWATCSVSVATWRKITEEHEGTRQIARIKSGEKEVYIALGTPNNVVAENQIYVPSWLVDHLGVDGAGNTVEVTWLTQEAFPEATRIVLRPQDSAFYHADAKEELERALTRLGVIRTGDTILVPLESLGGYEIPFDVVLTEPANIVLAQGDEVIMEFEEALDAISSEEDVEEEVEEESEEETEVVTPEPQGQTLGGEVRYLPDGRRWNPWRDAR